MPITRSNFQTIERSRLNFLAMFSHLNEDGKLKPTRYMHLGYVERPGSIIQSFSILIPEKKGNEAKICQASNHNNRVGIIGLGRLSEPGEENRERLEYPCFVSLPQFRNTVTALGEFTDENGKVSVIISNYPHGGATSLLDKKDYFASRVILGHLIYEGLSV